MIKKRNYEKGEIVFKDGDLDYAMYEVISGSVAVYVNYGKDDQMELSGVGEGELPGELGLIEKMKRFAKLAVAGNRK